MSTCRACRGTGLDTVLEMDPMPLAGTFPAKRLDAVVAPRYPLTWNLCRTCGLVNVEPDIPDALIYRTYSYAASTVPALVRHHAELAAYLGRIWRSPDPPRLLEIGCNDGVLLRQLPRHWFLDGVDPSDVAAKAPGRSWGLYNEPFNDELARTLGWYDLVVSSNSLAHFTDLAGAFDGVARVLRQGGLFVIEVHDLDATLAHCQWDTIYHEHKVEWSKDTLCAVLEPLGFEYVEGFKLPLHGGLLRMTFRRVERLARRPWVFKRSFRGLRVSYEHRRVPHLPFGSVAYGAAARASVYLNQLPALDIPYVIDGSPLRHGRYIAGRGIPVVSPRVLEDPTVRQPPAILITAWNHAADIEAKHPEYQGRWVTAWSGEP